MASEFGVWSLRLRVELPIFPVCFSIRIFAGFLLVALAFDAAMPQES